MIKEWNYCPECGSTTTAPRYYGMSQTEEQCHDCGQIYFTDIDYSDVVREKLSRLKGLEK